MGEFAESWSWLAFKYAVIEKDTDCEFLPLHILCGHISYCTSANFVFIYMQHEPFLLHILNNDRKNATVFLQTHMRIFVLTVLQQGRGYEFVLSNIPSQIARYLLAQAVQVVALVNSGTLEHNRGDNLMMLNS